MEKETSFLLTKHVKKYWKEQIFTRFQDDKYLHVNDHFQFIRLTDALRSPRLTFLEWFNPPQTTVIAGEKLQTFSVVGDEGVTDRVKLEEKLETSPQATTTLMRDLEPIQGRSLVDFPDYTFKYPGRFKIRVVSLESPDIHTPWQEIVVGPILSYSSKLNTVADEHIYLSSTNRLLNVTTTDKESPLLSQRTPKITLSKKDKRTLITVVYETDNNDSYLSSLKSIKDLSSYTSISSMLRKIDESHFNYDQERIYKPDHYTQTPSIECYEHSTNTDIDDFDYNNSKTRQNKILTPTRYRSVTSSSISNISPLVTTNYQKRSNDNETLSSGERIIIPTKFRLKQARIDKLLNDENKNLSEPELYKPFIEPDKSQRPPSRYGQQNSLQNRDSMKEENQSSQRSSSQYGQQSNLQNRDAYIRDSIQQDNQLSLLPSSQNRQQKDLQNRDAYIQDSLPRDKQSHYNHRNEFQQPNGSEKIPVDISSYNNPAQSSSYSRFDSNNETKIQQQQQRPIQNIGQDHTELVDNPYQITWANFELRGSRSDNNLYTYEPKRTQMELILKATLQNSDVQKSANEYIYATTDNRSGTDTPSNINHRIDSNETYDRDRPHSSSHANNQNSNKINPIYEDDDENEAKYSSASKLQAPGQQTTTNLDTYDDEGLHQRSHYSPQSRTPTDNYERIHPKQADNIQSSSLLSTPQASPSNLSENKSKYFFGKNIQNRISDDENNETECETFGHDSQARPLTNNNTKRNLDYASITHSQYPTNDNNYSENLQFKQQTDAGTTTANTLTQNKQFSSSTNQALAGKSQDSQQESLRITSTNKKSTYNDGNKNIGYSTSRQSHSESDDQNDSDDNEKIGHDLDALKIPPNKFNRNDDHNKQTKGDDEKKVYPPLYENTDHDSQNADGYIDNDNDNDNEDNDDDNISTGDDENHFEDGRNAVDHLVEKVPIVDRSAYAEVAEDTSGSKQDTNRKKKKKKKGKKPIEISVRPTDGRHLYTHGIIPPRPHSASTTDITDEITERTPFDKPHNFRYTPNIYLRDSRDNNEDDEEDSNTMPRYPEQNRNRPIMTKSELKIFKNYGTQSEEKPTRNIGTMSEPVQTSNFGNDVQPQSSSTQTFALIENNFISQDGIISKERDDSEPNIIYTIQRSSSVDSQEKNRLPLPILLRPKIYSDYERHPSTYKSPSSSTGRQPYFKSPQLTPQPPIPLQVFSPPFEYRSESDEEQQDDVSPSNKHLIPLLLSSNRSHKVKSQRQMASIETDTSLDGMRSSQHRGAQSEPLSTREFGTTTSSQKKRSSKTRDLADLNTILSQQGDDKLGRSGSSPPLSRKNYRLKPTLDDAEINNTEKINSNHDKPIPSRSNYNFDYDQKQTRNSFENDYHPPRRPAFEKRIDEEEQELTIHLYNEIPNQQDVAELRSDSSILLPSTNVTQPDTFPRVRRQLKLPTSQQNTESKLRHAQQQQIPSTNTSLVLNIGTENIILQSPDNEFTVPFERQYVYEPNHDFTTENEQIRSSTLKRDDLRTRNIQKILLPILNSSRTYVIEKQPLHGNPVRQSQTNGNFYLATSPTLRSLNSSYLADDSDINPLTQMIETTNLNGHEL
ncbi:unnamed protein product [Rotaria sp. Silwood2]|nr:unnamed protein product [Rotaria sp. Silwood2]